MERDNGDAAVSPMQMTPAGNGTVRAPSAPPSLSAVENSPKLQGEPQVSAIKSVDEKPANGGGAEIVSLDKFRKK